MRITPDNQLLYLDMKSDEILELDKLWLDHLSFFTTLNAYTMPIVVNEQITPPMVTLNILRFGTAPVLNSIDLNGLNLHVNEF